MHRFLRHFRLCNLLQHFITLVLWSKQWAYTMLIKWILLGSIVGKIWWRKSSPSFSITTINHFVYMSCMHIILKRKYLPLSYEWKGRDMCSFQNTESVGGFVLVSVVAYWDVQENIKLINTLLHSTLEPCLIPTWLFFFISGIQKNESSDAN